MMLRKVPFVHLINSCAIQGFLGTTTILIFDIVYIEIEKFVYSV